MKNKSNSFDIKKIFGSRSFKYGSNSLLLIAAVIGIAVLVNVLFSPAILKKVINKESLKLDLTPNKLFSLGETTDEIMKGITKEVNVYALYDEEKVIADPQLKEVDEIVKQYEKYSQIKLEHINIEKNPGFLTTIDPGGLKNLESDDVVFVSGNKIKKVSRYDFFLTEFDANSMSENVVGSAAEQNFTGAIRYVTSDETPVVYFLEGHDEKKLETDYKTVAEYLQRNNYEIKKLNLTIDPKVPDDAEIIIVAAPKKDLTIAERNLLNEYLKKGGQAVFAFDPIDTNPLLANFEEILKGYNVALNYDIVKENDTNRHVKSKPNDIVPDVLENSINEPLNPKELTMIMPKSRSINILKNESDKISVIPLMKTSNKAVGEAIDTSKGKNTQGALDLAVAVELKDSADSSKIIVTGNGSFMTDSAISQYETYSVNGLYFFLNSINWLQDKKDDVVIAPKTYSRPQIMMQAGTSNIIALITVVILPLLILGAGVYVWMRRKHL